MESFQQLLNRFWEYISTEFDLMLTVMSVWGFFSSLITGFMRIAKFIKKYYQWFLIPFSLLLFLLSKNYREKVLVYLGVVLLAYIAIEVIAKYSEKKVETA